MKRKLNLTEEEFNKFCRDYPKMKEVERGRGKNLFGLSLSKLYRE